jgi:hypothetical protein
MSLSNTLVTNEIKDASSAEVEFSRISTNGRTTEFAKVSETPNAPYRLKVSHLETGSGADLRRRSVVRFDKVVTGVSTQLRTVSAYVVVDAPVGDLNASTETKNVIANLLSFCATTGSGTTVLFDCTGNGASVLVDGSL